MVTVRPAMVKITICFELRKFIYYNPLAIRQNNDAQ